MWRRKTPQGACVPPGDIPMKVREETMIEGHTFRMNDLPCWPCATSSDVAAWLLRESVSFSRGMSVALPRFPYDMSSGAHASVLAVPMSMCRIQWCPCLVEGRVHAWRPRASILHSLWCSCACIVSTAVSTDTSTEEPEVYKDFF